MYPAEANICFNMEFTLPVKPLLRRVSKSSLEFLIFYKRLRRLELLGTKKEKYVAELPLSERSYNAHLVTQMHFLRM